MHIWTKKLLSAFAVIVGLAGVARAELSEFYVGVDGLETIASGTYLGLPNPNHGRLTFLYNHGNHYHGIGAFSHTGDNLGELTTVLDTNANNRVPETYTLQEPLKLILGEGTYAGKLVSAAMDGVVYSDLEMRNVHSLDGNPDDTEGLFQSSNGRWSGDLWNDNGHAHIHIELLSATPGLNVGTPNNPLAFQFGDAHLGDGNEMFSFTPVLWVNEDAAPGTYSAEFRLVDLNGEFEPSGRFYIDAQVVPEPSSVLLAALGAIAACGVVRHKRRQAVGK